MVEGTWYLASMAENLVTCVIDSLRDEKTDPLYIDQQTLEERIKSRRDYHNPAYRFRQHDQADIYDLAHLVPYCDVVVADKNWAHLATAGHLDNHYGTQILSGPADLSKWADAEML
jgi:hypothetical protein